SVGPYGAYLADGSEYRGDYQRSAEAFQAFHRPRVEALLDAGADLLACETLPSFAEITALAALLRDYPRARAWFSLTLRDAEHLSDGTPLREVVAVLADNPQVLALGINCIALENTTAALQHLHSLTSLPLVVYPNSGEHYDALTKTWHHHGEACATLAAYLPQWLAAGARLIGGCCRTTPQDIAALAAGR
ncbi:homocysteine S-methyltransferase, partial [Klebsiella aerogenes]